MSSKFIFYNQYESINFWQTGLLKIHLIVTPLMTKCKFLEEVILAEERTTEEERLHILEARKRAAMKKSKAKSSSGGLLISYVKIP